MARILGGVLVTLSLAGGALAVAGGPASADTGCVVYPLGDSAPVYETTSTSSAQIDTITYDSLGHGCTHTGGSAYDVCGGGSAWVFVRNKGGYAPGSCVETAE